MSKIISEEKFDKMAEELELTKIQLDEALRNNMADATIWEHKCKQMEKENARLKQVIKKLKAEKGILSRAVMILSEDAKLSEDVKC